MKKRILACSYIAITCAAPAHGSEETGAQALYDQHCIACHGAEVYTRDDRKVKSFPALERQVRRCETALGLRWFDEEIAEMTSLLNDRFYHYKP